MEPEEEVAWENIEMEDLQGGTEFRMKQEGSELGKRTSRSRADREGSMLWRLKLRETRVGEVL